MSARGRHERTPARAEVQAHAGGLETIYALHDAAGGDRLALVRDRALASALARQNDMAPVNVH